MVQEVATGSADLERLAGLLPRGRAETLRTYVQRARTTLEGRTVWHVSSTATGGGVAELLHTLLAYAAGAGVPNRWLVIEAPPAFFAFTKRLHNLLHGVPPDRPDPVSMADRDLYGETMAANLTALRRHVAPGDLVVLHDPQTAGLAEGLAEHGALVVWRCHVGRDVPNESTELAWSFLRAYLQPAQALVFSRRAYAPAWVPTRRLRVIPPSIDPYSAKNRELAPELASDLVHRVGLPSGSDLVVQVSRWDRLKDMAGVMEGFALMSGPGSGRLGADPHLVLAGPATDGVADDPEGAEVLGECRAQRGGLPPSIRARVHLLELPMADPVENALIVNAVQRSARVVVQKSLAEGFGLTVTEAMWKGRPVLSSRVGGIQDQVRHDVDGVLLDDPTDLDAFAAELEQLLVDRARSARLGAAARTRVLDQYVGDRHLEQYVDLFADLLGRPA